MGAERSIRVTTNTASLEIQRFAMIEFNYDPVEPAERFIAAPPGQAGWVATVMWLRPRT